MNLKGRDQADGASLFSVMPSNKTRGSRQKLIHRKHHLNMRKHFFTVQISKHWNKFPRDVVESLALEMFKKHLDIILCPVLWMTLLDQGGWTR